MKGSRSDLWNNPEECCRWLNGELNQHGINVTVTRADREEIILNVTFAEVDLGEELPYQAERVSVVVRPDQDPMAIPPSTDQRTWYHRYPWTTLRRALQPRTPINLGPLCLWAIHDPPHLRWNWSHGVAAYLLIVQRHLLAEEYYRRHGHWPVEDVPHGSRPDGKPHPILDPELRAAS